MKNQVTTRDHPRVCGENLQYNGTIPLDKGSPPRVRGKQTLHPLQSHPQRITPACAGKTGSVISFNESRKDHPRVCGENVHRSAGLLRDSGSPPRVRGKPATYNSNQIRMRITPACAGKTPAEV